MSKALPMALPSPNGRPDILLIAGEHSGDEHAARLVRELLQGSPTLNICAVSGRHAEKAGAQLIYDLTVQSVVGFVEVLKNYGFFKQFFETLTRWIKEYRPKAICFVDYPGFNLRLAQRLFDEGLASKAGGDISLLYYIGPQIWAWKAKRRFKMAKLLNAAGVIFPFEVGCYNDTDLDVEFVGHPFAAPDYEPPVSYQPDGDILLLPGSRNAPVSRIFPEMLKGFAALRKDLPSKKAVVIYPSENIRSILISTLATFPPEIQEAVTLQPGGTTIPAGAVLTSSGTMSLSCALAGIPGAIVYRAHPLTYLWARQIISIKYLGIANILLDRNMYPEYIQHAATAAALRKELLESLTSGPRIQKTLADREELQNLLEPASTATPGRWLLRKLSS